MAQACLALISPCQNVAYLETGILNCHRGMMHKPVLRKAKHKTAGPYNAQPLFGNRARELLQARTLATVEFHADRQ